MVIARSKKFTRHVGNTGETFLYFLISFAVSEESYSATILVGFIRSPPITLRHRGSKSFSSISFPRQDGEAEIYYIVASLQRQSRVRGGRYESTHKFPRGPSSGVPNSMSAGTIGGESILGMDTKEGDDGFSGRPTSVRCPGSGLIHALNFGRRAPD